jgi:hypothetical protein
VKALVLWLLWVILFLLVTVCCLVLKLTCRKCTKPLSLYTRHTEIRDRTGDLEAVMFETWCSNCGRSTRTRSSTDFLVKDEVWVREDLNRPLWVKGRNKIDYGHS